MGTFDVDANGEVTSGLNHEGPLVRWATRKYKKLRNHRTRAWQWLLRVTHREPTLLLLWVRQRRVFTIGAV